MSSRYRLTYPYKGSIYRSKEKKRAVRECYKDFKKLTGHNEGLFIVTDIDKKTEYKYKVNKKNKQKGGNNKLTIPNSNKMYNIINNTSNPFSKKENNEFINLNNNLDLKLSDNNEITKDKIEEIINNKLEPIKKQLFVIAERIDNKFI